MTHRQNLSPVLAGILKVLRDSEGPLSASEIVERGRQLGVLKLDGHTPHKTVGARLAEHIRENSQTSLVMRTASGRYVLRSESQEPEYIAPRRTIALYDEEILAFDASMLRDFVPENGLSTADVDHANLISSCFPVRRSEAEKRYDIIQLISVYVVRYNSYFLTYRRGKRLPEERLQHSYSCFFGGHLNPSDLMPLFRLGDPEQALYLLDRELSEELILPTAPTGMRFKGLLYDPRTRVSEQHIGITFIVDLATTDFTIGERGFLTDAKFETIPQMRERISEFENWSQLLIQDEIWRWN